MSVPIIDLSDFRSPDLATRAAASKSLLDACTHVGFFYIKNHGVSETSIASAFEWAKKLFSLPLEKKNLAPHPPGFAVHRGYSEPGLEKVSRLTLDEAGGAEGVKKLREVVDCKESYEIGSEDNKEQPNQWLPEEVLPGYREAMMKFYWECYEASLNLYRALAMALGLKDTELFVRFHKGGNNQLRLLHYPPVKAGLLEKGLVERIGGHTDWGSATMLFQDDCGGLQVEHPTRPGEYIDATPISGTCVVNIADLMQRWSNDTLKSTVHRVHLPPFDDRSEGPERMTKSRYSIPYFMAPELGKKVEVLKECTTEANPAKYKPVDWREWNLERAAVSY